MSIFGWLFGSRDYLDSLGDSATVFPLEAGLEYIHAATDAGGLYSDVANYPAVSRARRLLKNTAGMIPLVAYRDGEPVDPQPALARRPDPSISRGRFVRESVDSMIRGDAFWRLAGVDPSTSRPSAAVVLDPSEVRVQWNGNRTRRLYWYRDVPLDVGSDLVHIPFDVSAGALRGRSLYDTHLARLIASAESQALDWFDGDGEPFGELHSTEELTGPEALELLGLWRKQRAMSRTAVTGGNLSYNRIGVDPTEAQLLETRRWHVTEVARHFGIPGPLLLAEVASSGVIQYANIGALFSELIRTTIRPDYLAPIEEALSDLLPRGLEVRFDTWSVESADLNTRLDMYGRAIGSKIVTPAEVRRWEGITELASDRPPPNLQPAPNAVPDTEDMTL